MGLSWKDRVIEESKHRVVGLDVANGAEAQCFFQPGAIRHNYENGGFVTYEEFKNWEKTTYYFRCYRCIIRGGGEYVYL